MTDEKKMILKMLEEGKITAQEASELLEACSSDKFENSFASKFSSSVEKAVKKAAEKIENIDINIDLDDLMKNSRKFVSSFPYEVSDSTKIEDEIKSVDVNIANGSVNIQRSYESNVRVDEVVAFKSKEDKQDDILDVIVNDGTLMISVKEGFEERTKSEVEIYLPTATYDNLKVRLANGSFELSDTNFKNSDIENVNGRIEIENSESNFKLEDVNGRIALKNTKGNVDARNVNGNISLNHITGEDLDVKCVNGSIKADAFSFNNSNLKSQNGRISITSILSGKSIVATTSNGEIFLDSSDYNGNVKANIKGASVSFSDKFENVKKENGEYTISKKASDPDLDIKIKSRSGDVTIK